MNARIPIQTADRSRRRRALHPIARVLCALFPASVLAAGPPVQASGALPDGALLVTTIAAEQSQRAAGLRDLVLAALEQQDAATARGRLAAEADPLVFELAGAGVLDSVRGQRASAAARELVQWLAEQPPRAFTRHEETRSDWFVALVDLPTRATGTLALWQRMASRDDWAGRIGLDPAGTIAALQRADGADIAAAVDALEQLDESAFPAFRAAAAAADLPAAVWMAIAARSPDPVAIEKVLDGGDAAQRLALVERIAAMPAAQSVKWLQRAAADPELASAATLALTALAEHDRAAERWLEHALDDPALGPSAAAGLARWAGASRVGRIERLLDQAAGPTRAGHLALALRLDGSPRAAAVLARWAGDPRLPEALRRELQR